MSSRVEHYDLFRYLVQSEERDHQYLVDISSYDWNGECDCPHFQCRLAPRVRDGEKGRCKHIHAAREVALDDIGRRLQKAMEPAKESF